MKENEEVKPKKNKIGKILIIIGMILIALGSIVFMIPKFRNKVLGNGLSGEKKEIYNSYIKYLSKYENNEVTLHNGKKEKEDYIFVRILQVDGVDKALSSDGGILDMYYMDKDGKVVYEQLPEYTFYNGIFDYEKKEYDYYLLYTTGKNERGYDHIVSLADYINKKDNKKEYDVIDEDPRFIGFELDEKVTIDGNAEKALKEAIKTSKTLKEFYKQEKEIIDDAHQEYKAMHEDDDEDEIKEEVKEVEKLKTKCNSGFVYVGDDKKCYNSHNEKAMDTSCKNGFVDSPGGCAEKVDASLCDSGNEQYETYNGNCIDKYTDSSKPMNCPKGYEILFGSYGGQEFNGGCYKYEKPNY